MEIFESGPTAPSWGDAGDVGTRIVLHSDLGLREVFRFTKLGLEKTDQSL